MKSLKLSIMLLGIVTLIGCQKLQKWEYKVISVPNEGYETHGSADALLATTVTLDESELNKLGSEGWELVTSYLELETAHPNFGDEKYVTGLQPNVRPQRAILLFKRHLKEKKPH